jgi:hypothetical protein
MGLQALFAHLHLNGNNSLLGEALVQLDTATLHTIMA